MEFPFLRELSLLLYGNFKKTINNNQKLKVIFLFIFLAQRIFSSEYFYSSNSILQNV